LQDDDPVIDGSIQTFSLTLDAILDHAAKWHCDTQVVTAREGRENARVTYAGLRDRAKRVSAVLAGFGVETGQRVATLAWNTQAHMEAWFGIMGMGAVCHTLNPRLTAVQLAWMLDQSGARIVIVSADLAKLALEVADHAAGVEHVLVIDGVAGASHARAGSRPWTPCSRPPRATCSGAGSTRPRRRACASPRARPARPRA
jgi:acyl-CoA synthetase (AMP-forming)/AMP-acid ligase II